MRSFNYSKLISFACNQFVPMKEWSSRLETQILKHLASRMECHICHGWSLPMRQWKEHNVTQHVDTSKRTCYSKSSLCHVRERAIERAHEQNKSKTTLHPIIIIIVAAVVAR